MNKIKLIFLCVLSLYIFNSISNGIIKKGKNPNGFYIYQRHVAYPASNAYNPAMVSLGKLLFYDINLSSTRSFSCGDCHQPKNAFADTIARSYSFISNKQLPYNTPSLVNLAFNKTFGYEGKYDNLEEFIKDHIGDERIMNMNNTNIISYYSQDTQITNFIKMKLSSSILDSILIYKSIAQYIRTKISINTTFEKKLWEKKLITKHDSIISKVMFQKLSPRTQFAIDLCIKCHTGIAFGGEGTANNGLDADSKNTVEYKIANIKNLQLTGPYMHDGRFKTIEEVVEFYNSDVQYNKCLDPMLQVNGKPIRLNLNDAEKKEIVNFLKSFIDTTYNKVNSFDN